MLINEKKLKNLQTRVSAIYGELRDVCIDIEALQNHNCGHCMKYNSTERYCTHHKAIVPEHIIPIGCEDFDYDYIPF